MTNKYKGLKDIFSIALFIKFILLVVLLLPGQAFAQAPSDENYDDDPSLNITSNNFVNDGVRYQISGPTTYRNATSNGTYNLSEDGSSDYALQFDQDGVGGITNITISTSDGSAFQLASLSFDILSDTDVQFNSDNGGNFTLSPNDGLYVLYQNYDFTSKAGFENITSLTISGTNMVITIDDLNFETAQSPNSAPTDISLSPTTVNQSDATNATVGILSTTDADGGDTHSYSLVAGTSDDDNASFNISGSTLRADDASSLAPGNYSVRIQTDDGNGGTYEEAFSVTVNDDVAPDFENSTPSISGTGVSKTTLTARLDEVGTVYYVVVADGDGAPGTTQVKAGQDSGGSAPLASGSINVGSASQDFTDDITGLSTGTAYDIYVVAEDDEPTPNLQNSTTKIDVTMASPDSDGSLTAAGGVNEPVGIGATVDTPGEAVNVFDFTLIDGGTADGLSMNISEIRIGISGTSSDTERGQITWRLNGSDVSNVSGTYDDNSDEITFSAFNISVADNASETYTISAYYNDNSNLTEDHTFKLAVDGDTDLTVDANGTQIGATTAITNGAGSTIDVTATKLAFTTQPNGSTSGSVLTTNPVVTAQDAFGNTDIDFTETITLTEASAGNLSGDTDIAAVNGVSTFTDVAYTATTDQESFTLTANDEDGTGSDISTADANSVAADVVATKLAFTTEPTPTTVAREDETSFTTVPVVSALDDNGTLDTGFSTDIQLKEINGSGSAKLSVTGDQDGSASTITVTPASGKATFTDLAITYTPAGSGAETFNLQASSGGLSTASSTPLTANQEPSFNNGSKTTLSLNEGDGATDINSLLAITDADAGNTLSWSVSSSPSEGSLSGFPANKTSNSGTVSPSGLTYTPKADATGPDSFDIQISDGWDTDIITVNVTLNAVNNPPAFDSSPVTAAKEGEPYSYMIEASDPDNDGLTITADQIPDWGTLTDNGDGTATLKGTPSPDDMGDAAVKIEVNDGTVSVTQSFTITVDNTNRAPSFTSTPVTKAQEDQLYTYEITAHDPDGDALAFSASQKPKWATLTQTSDSTATLNGTPGFEDMGDASVKLDVSDGTLSATQTFTIAIGDNNRAPSFTSTPVTKAQEKKLYIYHITAHDADGDTLHFNAPQKPKWANFAITSDSTAILKGTPDVEDSGDSSVKLAVSDGVLTVEQEFTISVTNTNRAPSFTSDPIKTGAESKAYRYTIKASDPDGDSLAFSIDQTPSWASFTDNGDGTATLKGTPGYGEAGSYSIEIQVNDGEATAKQSFTLTVTTTNQKPTIVSQPVVIIPSGLTYRYVIAAVDTMGDQNDPLTFKASLANGDKLPAWLSWKEVSSSGKVQKRALTGTPPMSAIGAHQIVVTVSDNGKPSLTAIQKYTLTISQGNRQPSISSTPVQLARTAQTYSYTVKAEDPDSNSVTFSARLSGKDQLPKWLEFKDNGDGTATFSGKPKEKDIGSYNIDVRATDNGTPQKETTQHFKLKVKYKVVKKLKALYNYPNPFQNVTNIKFELPKKGKVYLQLYNTLGSLVRKTSPKVFNTGANEFVLHARNLASGIYIYRIVSTNDAVSGRLTLIK